MKFFVTGATGFLGRKIVNMLVGAGHSAICTKRSTSHIGCLADNDSVTFVNISDDDWLKGFDEHDIDCVIHCATNYGRKDASISDMIYTNITLPAILLDAAVSKGVRYFINTDTALSEGVSAYSFSKKQFLRWSHFFSQDIKVINLSLEHFYGPGDSDSKFVSYLITNLRDNNSRSLALSEGLQKRDFIYIDDVISAYKVVVDNIHDFTDSFTEIGVGTNNLISIRELVLLVKKLTNNTKTKLDFGAIPQRDGEMQSDCDISFLGKLGWTPKYSLEDGIAESIWQSR
jgi:nucleoside-diphosphate-sugar epimerase